MARHTYTKIAAILAGAALAATGPAAIASAAPGSSDGGGSSFGSTGPLGTMDSGSLGIGEGAPKMDITQNEGVVSVDMHNPEGFFGICAPVMIEAAQSLRVLDDPASLLAGGTGVTLFNPPPLIGGGSWTSMGAVPDGLYTVLGVCTGLPPADTAVMLMSVPGDIPGSISGAIDLTGAVVAGS